MMVVNEQRTGLKHRELWEAFWADRESRNAMWRLMEAWMPFVRSVLKRITIRLPAHAQVEDLLQAASLGLCEAIDRFDPDRGISFESFAYHRVRGAVMDELRINDHLSKGVRAKVNLVKDTVSRLTKQMGRPPEDEELIGELGMSRDELAAIMESSNLWLSLDQVIASDESGKEIFLQDVLADSNDLGPDVQAERSDVSRVLRCAFRELSDREQKILYLYYFEELRLAEIAALFELSEARICQIHAMSVMKLKAAMSSYEERAL